MSRFDEQRAGGAGGLQRRTGARDQTGSNVSGGDPDQFMTAIDIDSTRLYVQTIYGYYNIYRALYGAVDYASARSCPSIDRTLETRS